MKRIVFTDGDGSVGVFHPASDATKQYKRATGWDNGGYFREEGEGVKVWVPPNPDPSEEAVFDWLASKAVPEGLTHRLADLAEIPADRYFREAWEDVGTIQVNMDKARIIHMDKIRKARDKKLKELDIEQLKGKEVAAEKQALRDIPQTFDLTVAQTPEELKALWPEEL